MQFVPPSLQSQCCLLFLCLLFDLNPMRVRAKSVNKEFILFLGYLRYKLIS